MKNLQRSFLCIFFLGTFSSQLFAQLDPTLSIQGILKKSSGLAVEDGTYTLVFRLYTVETGGSPLWTETQDNVEVSSGIYSAALGTVAPLNVAFDQLYYLGVTIGSTEMSPRLLLTSAPYALSLIGQTNKFPSSGKVLADSIQVNGSVRAKGGAPGLNGANKNGYAFSGNNGDNDSGLFSTADGKVALYSNNTEVLAVTPSNVAVDGTLALNNNGGLSYNNQNDWRLVETDYLEVNNEGWLVSDPIGPEEGAWRNSSTFPAQVTDFGNAFTPKALFPTNNDQVFKKQFNLSGAGAYTYVKVKFIYYMIDEWYQDQPRLEGWAAFSTDPSGGTVRVGWTGNESHLSFCHFMQNNNFFEKSNFGGNPSTSDQWVSGEMVARYPSSASNNFYVFFGYANDIHTAFSNFAVGAIEIWVK